MRLFYRNGPGPTALDVQKVFTRTRAARIRSLKRADHVCKIASPTAITAQNINNEVALPLIAHSRNKETVFELEGSVAV